MRLRYAKVTQPLRILKDVEIVSRSCNFVVHLKHRSLQCFFDSNNRVNREIVSPTHPFTYLCLALAKHEREIFLPQVTLHKNLMNAVNNLK